MIADNIIIKTKGFAQKRFDKYSKKGLSQTQT